MFNESEACSLIKCPGVTGKYFVDGGGICKSENCTNKPKVTRLYLRMLLGNASIRLVGSSRLLLRLWGLLRAGFDVINGR